MVAVREYLPRRNPGDGVHAPPTFIVPFPMAPNLLAYGDNLDVLRRHVPAESVDLIYLDPPFNSQADYNVLFAQQDGTPAAAQIKAFGDTWKWDQAAIAAFTEVVEAGGELSRVMQAFRTILGRSNMLAYLSMMAPRLQAMHDKLKPTGVLFLHCDPTASHYLKLLLDAVFDAKNYRNEIVWRYRRWPSKQRNFQRMHDVLLRYSKSDQVIWNQLYEPLSEQTQKRMPTGERIVTTFDEHGKKRIRPSAVQSLGAPMSDVWEIPQIVGPTRERLGYPTQKPEALLARVILSGSEPGDVVLDPFCGCGTAVAVAERLGRKWIGIDITHHAIGLIKHRLQAEYGPGISSAYSIIGEPTTVEDAVVLAREDPYQFQSWALGLVGARNPIKPGGDGGIDGQSYFHDFDGGPTRTIVFSVKGGHLVPAFVRDLRGVLEREAAEIAVLISMAEPTPGMRAEAAEAGTYLSSAGRFPRLQLRTVAELLRGRDIDRPSGRPKVAEAYEQAKFFDDIAVPRIAAASRAKKVRPSRKSPSIHVKPPLDTEAARTIRTDYVGAEHAASPEAPRSPRTSTHDRTAPLPLPESVDRD